MFSKCIILSLFIFLSGHAYSVSYDAKKNKTSSMMITWVFVDDVNKACAAEYAKYSSKLKYKVDACAVWTANKCKIITKRRPTEEDVGHEIMHCFQEHFHD